MPAGVLPDEGIGDQLEYILKRTISGVLPWQLILFKNDVTPDAATVLADLEEATFTGYGRVDLIRDTWTVPTVDDGCAVSTWGDYPVEWWVTGGLPETLYGYAMIDSTLEVIRFVQRFDEEDIVPLEIGSRVLLLPTYTLTSGECSASMLAARARLRSARKDK